MSKPPSTDAEPDQPRGTGPDTVHPSLAPPSPLLAAIAAKMTERSARTGAGAGAGAEVGGSEEADAALLKQCAIVSQVNTGATTIDADEWQRALLLVSSLQPRTLPGLRAKVGIALMLAGVEPEPGDEIDNPDRMLIWLTLADVQTILEDPSA